MDTVKYLNSEYAKRQSVSSNTPSFSTNSGSTPLNRYSSVFNSTERDSGSNRRGSNSNPVAVALLLGTTADSPLLGTLSGSSPAPNPPLVSGLGKSAGQQPILSCRRVKVTFKDEPGEGSGVARSFFTAFAEAVLSQESLPALNRLLQSTSNNSVTRKS